ncbi:TPA: hypothetical protein N4790_004560, partial [Shigella sonnei]|nr:hypothetical protein [Shigella sonnei]
GYDVALSDVYWQPSSDPADETVRLEGIIVKCAVALGNRLGVALNPQEVFRKPKETVRILDGITSKFEEFEDTDTLYGLVMSGETPEFILESICRYVYGDDNIHFEDLVIRVSPRVMTVMRNYLSAMVVDEQLAVGNDARLTRIAEYLRLYPQNPSAFVFLNLPEDPDLTVVQQSLVFDVEDYSETELLEMYTVGLSIIDNDDFDDAYADLSTNLEKLNNDGLQPITVLQPALKSLRLIYQVEEAEHDDEV